jgi:hypothetical protein
VSLWEQLTRSDGDEHPGQTLMREDLESAPSNAAGRARGSLVLRKRSPGKPASAVSEPRLE